MSSTQLDHIADQLLVILDEMRSYLSTMLGAVTGGTLQNPEYPLEPSTRIFEHQGIPGLLPRYISRIWTRVCGRVIQLLFDRGTALYLTHGVFLPRNVLVDGPIQLFLTGTGDNYPELWEYCRMHDPGWTAPAWGRVFTLIFPKSALEEGDMGSLLGHSSSPLE